MSVYRVGPVPYRGHKPGTIFEANLPDDVERRALLRNAIELLDRSETTLVEGSYDLPIRPRGRKRGAQARQGASARKRATGKAAEAAGKEAADAVTDTDQSKRRDRSRG